MNTDYDFRPLIQSVLIQANLDLRDTNPAKALDAAMFFIGDDAPMWADVAGLGDTDLVKHVTSGRSRQSSQRRDHPGVLALFEGLNEVQAQEMTALILPTLAAIRDQVTNPKREK